MKQQTKRERVHNVFQNISDHYDKMNAIISFNRHRAWRKDVMKRMKVERGKKALDVCTGTGDWALALAEAVGDKGNVIGLDFSENMLKVAEEKLAKTSLKNVSFINGDAMDLPFPDNSFDYVTIGFGLRNVPDYKRVLKEMHRVCKPGGQVVCLETSQPTLFGYRQLYYFYFQHIMPLFGKIFAKSYDEYAWLNESAREFPGKEELKEMFLNVGFKEVKVKSYSGGVAAMHLAIK